MKAQTGILFETETGKMAGLITSCGDAHEFMDEAYGIVKKHKPDLPEEWEENHWSDIMYDREGNVLAIYAEGELDSSDARLFYVALEYDDCPEAFEAMWLKDDIDTSAFDSDFNPNNPNYSELYENAHCRLAALKVHNRILFRVYYKNDLYHISRDFWEKIEMDDIFVNVPDDATDEDFGIQYTPSGATISMTEENYVIDLNTGLGEEYYSKANFDLKEAISQALIKSEIFDN